MITTITRNSGTTIQIRTEGEPLCQEDADYIKNMPFIIFFNECDLYYWSSDERLPSGRWLENIRWEDGLSNVMAYIGPKL